MSSAGPSSTCRASSPSQPADSSVRRVTIVVSPQRLLPVVGNRQLNADDMSRACAGVLCDCGDVTGVVCVVASYK
jgi:hypothetical protein